MVHTIHTYISGQVMSPEAGVLKKVSLAGLAQLSRLSLKVHKHDIFFLTFFAETETIWSQGPVT
jgi:hypothetical protein